MCRLSSSFGHLLENKDMDGLAITTMLYRCIFFHLQATCGFEKAKSRLIASTPFWKRALLEVSVCQMLLHSGREVQSIGNGITCFRKPELCLL